MSSSSHFRESAGKPAAVFSHKRNSSQETFADRRGISSGHPPVQGKGETLLRFSDPEKAARTVLEEQRDHLLADAKSEMLKQECKDDTLNTCIREFQRQARSNRLEMDGVSCGHGESRRELARLHEELAQREKALPDPCIRNIHEVEELKRAQEMRIDEFSRHELRESPATIQKLASQIQELQERMNYMNDSREFQDVEAICSGKLSHVPSQPAIVPSLVSRDQSLRPDTWNLLGTSGNVFDSPRAVIDSSSKPYLPSWNQSATGGNPVRESTRKPVARSEERNRETVPTPRSARRPSTLDSLSPVEGAYPQNYVADQQRLKISELQFDKIPTPSTFSCWKIRFKTQVLGNVMDQRTGDGRFSGRFEIIALNSGFYSFPEF